MVKRGIVRVTRPIDSDDFLAKHVHVPHHLGAGGEIVAALGSYLPFGGGTVVAFAAHLDGKGGSALQEFASRSRTHIISHIRAEGPAAREVHNESDVVPISSAQARPASMTMQRDKYLSGRTTGQ